MDRTASTDVDARPSVMVVEDHPETRFFLHSALEDDYDVVEVDSAEAALGLAESRHFDLLLIDIALGPGRDGVQLVHRLRDIPGYEDTPAVAMTAHLVLDRGNAYLAEGFDTFLGKPFRVEALRQMLARLTQSPPS